MYPIITSFFFSSRSRHTRSYGDWSSDVCSSDLEVLGRRAVLDERCLAGLVEPLLGCDGDRLELLGLEGVERREACEKSGPFGCVQGVHCRRSIPVRPAPCNKSLVLPGSPAAAAALSRRRGCRRTSKSSTTRAVG